MSTIWIIDDDQGLLESLKMALEEEFEVRIFNDPYACLAAVRIGQPDILLTDYEMQGMNGVELIIALDKFKGSIRIVLCSGCLSIELRDKALSAGAMMCLEKPVNLYELKQIINRV